MIKIFFRGFLIRNHVNGYSSHLQATMVNFSFFGMLQRLQECHSKVGDAAPIRFPRQERYGRYM